MQNGRVRSRLNARKHSAPIRASIPTAIANDFAVSGEKIRQEGKWEGEKEKRKTQKGDRFVYAHASRKDVTHSRAAADAAICR